MIMVAGRREHATLREWLDHPDTNGAQPGEWASSWEQNYCTRCPAVIWPYERHLVGEKGPLCGDCGEKLESGHDWRLDPCTRRQRSYILDLAHMLGTPPDDVEVPETKGEARSLISQMKGEVNKRRIERQN